jgi:hypothetical protein
MKSTKFSTKFCFPLNFSIKPDSSDFEPRIINNQKEQIPLVWAIDEEHSINNYFPRECLRIIYYKDQ